MIPGSALRKLEAITGLKASKAAVACFRLDIVPGMAFFSFLKDEQAACKDLRECNWRRVTRLVFQAQDWKCKTCGQIKPLQGHHILFRSRWKRSDGPLDVVSNITALCSQCHEDEHRKTTASDTPVTDSLKAIDAILAGAE